MTKSNEAKASQSREGTSHSKEVQGSETREKKRAREQSISELPSRNRTQIDDRRVKSRATPPETETRRLNNEEYKRYGRQMILPQVGLNGQLALKAARVLIVGAGGLGCPAATYLARAGIGTLGIIDGDSIELSNIHRQILYDADEIGENKAGTAETSLSMINDNLIFRSYEYHLEAKNALKVIGDQYDLILDCTDHPSSRYLISDLAVIAGVPLISASALKTEGQLLVLNNPPCRRNTVDHRGFCYRCVFPKPPPPEALQTCSEGGILGPVVGTMGTLMATEAIKLLTRDEPMKLEDSAKTMLLYSAYNDTPFRMVRLKGKRADCPTCSWPPKIDRSTLKSRSFDYQKFCGVNNARASETENRILPSSWTLNHDLYANKTGTRLIDVRNQTEFDMCHIPGSVNVPLSDIQSSPDILKEHVEACQELPPAENGEKTDRVVNPMVFVCRYGNDSQEAVKIAEKYRRSRADLRDVVILDMTGGLKGWKEAVDPEFPEY
ncbi:uncharacterized protein KY384_008938 [Bacidia gigantensis]|uniref:uncharacterized protein n=1 Tax=Bacidia gigantensis TaxID=2732470 RepID=UPI001D052E49|nr:uncharacterized protein KY384_008938 [Bacidia gigantensis]KAG8525294.1 hypothetical protein KY384_008938 [Bacidia gigantensis]